MSTKWIYTAKAEADGVGKAGAEVNTAAGGPTQEYLELHKYIEEATAVKARADAAASAARTDAVRTADAGSPAHPAAAHDASVPRPDAGSLAHPTSHASMPSPRKVNE